MDVILMYPGMTGISVPALPFASPSIPEKFGYRYAAVMVLLSAPSPPTYAVAMVTVVPSSDLDSEIEQDQHFTTLL
jgi:hypothetical protein